MPREFQFLFNGNGSGKKINEYNHKIRHTQNIEPNEYAIKLLFERRVVDRYAVSYEMKCGCFHAETSKSEQTSPLNVADISLRSLATGSYPIIISSIKYTHGREVGALVRIARDKARRKGLRENNKAVREEDACHAANVRRREKEEKRERKGRNLIKHRTLIAGITKPGGPIRVDTRPAWCCSPGCAIASLSGQKEERRKNARPSPR